MQTAELLDLMSVLKLRGMRAAFEDTLSEGLKRKLSFHQILGKLFASEIEERKLRSIRYQLGVANLPMSKSLDTFQFAPPRSTSRWCDSGTTGCPWSRPAT